MYLYILLVRHLSQEYAAVFCVFFLAMLCGLWNLSSPTSDRTSPTKGSAWAPAVEAQSYPLDHEGIPWNRLLLKSDTVLPFPLSANVSALQLSKGQ